MVAGMSLQLVRTYGFVGDLRLESIVRRRNGETRRMIQKAHSPLANWGRLIKALFDASSETIILPDGSTITFDGTLTFTSSKWCNGGSPTIDQYRGIRLDAGEGDSSYGFVVGYGTKPVDFWDFNLENKYEHGETLSKMFYRGTNIFTDYSQQITIDNKTYLVMAVIIERTFENHAPSPQDIKETGLIVRYYEQGDGSVVSEIKFLVFRDVLDNPITLDSYESVTLRYHLRWLLPL